MRICIMYMYMYMYVYMYIEGELYIYIYIYSTYIPCTTSAFGVLARFLGNGPSLWTSCSGVGFPCGNGPPLWEERVGHKGFKGHCLVSSSGASTHGKFQDVSDIILCFGLLRMGMKLPSVVCSVIFGKPHTPEMDGCRSYNHMFSHAPRGHKCFKGHSLFSSRVSLDIFKIQGLSAIIIGLACSEWT